jgi:glycine/D-amino acid oxidase-like deaminating enzyme
MGCSAAYQLKQAGAGRVILLERHSALGTQTSWAGAGFVSLWALGAPLLTTPDLDMQRYAISFYRCLSADHDIGFKPVGFLGIAVTDEGAQRLRERYDRACLVAAPGEIDWLGATEMAEAAPIVTRSRIRSGLFIRPAVRVEAERATRAVGREAAASGVVIHTGVAVTAIETVAARVVGVRTSRGVIQAGAVVAAAGPWLHHIGQLVGVSLPAIPKVLPRIVSAPHADVSPDLPLMIFEDYRGLWVREAVGGLLVGLPGSELRGKRWVPATDPPWADGAESPLTDEVEEAARAFAPTLPVLGCARIVDRRSGIPTYTPDGRHLLGAVPGVDGLYVIGGDNEVGITHGPGLGKMVAELIMTGATSWDCSGYRLDRFLDV